MKVPLLGGAYSARSVIASAQRCVNLYSEKGPTDSEGKSIEDFPFTFYPTPGIVTRATAASKGWRCLYNATDNRLFGVVGQDLVLVMGDYTIKVLGQVESSSGQCYMQDNTTTIVVVDGSPTGYTIDMATLAVNKINDDAFYGSARVDQVDGYMIFNRPSTRQWYISLNNQIAFDPLDFASKTGSPDLLVAAVATRRNVFLFGEQTTEIWTNTGGDATTFTFSRLSGAFLQFGCASADSLAQADGSIYFLARSQQGQFMVLRTMNYDRERISNFAIENEFTKYGKVNDAIGYVHQMSGHIFYVLTFPTANKTWVYDAASDHWHEWLHLNADGTESRHRGSCFAHWNGKQMIGDYQTGQLYEARLDIFTDDGSPIRRIRSFPHLSDDGTRLVYKEFKAEMQVGAGPYGSKPEIRLRWSNTKGESWSTPISASLGNRGEFLTDCRFLRLGVSRSRVFELSWSADCPTALSGAYIQIQKCMS